MVSGIRRPAWSDWALNVTSPAHPDEVEAFAAAAAAVRTAQEAAIDGLPQDVRDALQHLRQTTTALVDVARPALAAEGRAADLPELRARLTEIAASPSAVEQLRTGVLGTGQEVDSPLFADLPGPPPEATRRPTPAPAQPAAARRDDPPAEDAAARRRLMRVLADAERNLKRAQRSATRAQEDLEEASAAAAQAERRLGEAQQRLDDAVDAVDRAEAARAEAASALDVTS